LNFGDILRKAQIVVFFYDDENYLLKKWINYQKWFWQSYSK